MLFVQQGLSTLALPFDFSGAWTPRHLSWKSRRPIPCVLTQHFHVLSVHCSSRAPKMWETLVSFNVSPSVSSSSMARSICWPWALLILISISLLGEHGVGASAVPPPPGDSCNSHASSAAGKIAAEILGGLLSGVIFVGALYRLAAEVAPPLRFFICHTGGINQEGKNFPERLYDEMTQSLKLKFFIEVFFDRRVLPGGLLFPPHILKELERTQVGIVLVTPDFFTRKWPMVELVQFVEFSERISNMRRVLPLFYRMTVRQVQDNLRDGVWEAEWRKMCTHVDHPLSVQRCRHAVRELCKYKGVEYSGSDHDRGRDREYIREILKCVGKIVCEEIWKSNRAKDSVNSSSRGHPPETSGEVIELVSTPGPQPRNPHPPPPVAPPSPDVAPSSNFSNDGDLASGSYLAPQTPPGPEHPSPYPPLPLVAPNSSFSLSSRLATAFPRRLWFFTSHASDSEDWCCNFTRWLYDEMTKTWKRKFFTRVFLDQRLFVDEKSTLQQTFLELKKTDICLVLITKDYFKQKWAMLELVSFVESYERNPIMRKLIPVFYEMRLEQVRDNLKDGVWDREWTRMSQGKHPLSVERYRHAVERLFDFRGIQLNEDIRDTDREFIRKILRLVDRHASINAMWKRSIELLSR